MVQAWIFDEKNGSDQRDPHTTVPIRPISIEYLKSLGVLYWKIDPLGCEQDTWKGELGNIRKERGYKNYDIITVSPDKLPNYHEKLKTFFNEHIHEDEEIRFVLEGSGYFDVRNDKNQEWIRIYVESGDMLVLPAGIYHRFTLDLTNYIRVIRLFQDAPKWEAINRGETAEQTPARHKYLEFTDQTVLPADTPSNTIVTSGLNGESFLLQNAAKSIANYPHMRAYGGFLYVSGLSSRRPDNTHIGAELVDGEWQLDIKAQTAAVLNNIANVLAQIPGTTLQHVIDMQVFLTDMKHYAEYNTIYNQFFPNPLTAPTRTTVAVKQLPHPNLLIEIKAVAVDIRAQQK